jgi:hypothetical protein
MDKKAALEALQKAMDRLEKNVSGKSAADLKARGPRPSVLRTNQSIRLAVGHVQS